MDPHKNKEKEDVFDKTPPRIWVLSLWVGAFIYFAFLISINFLRYQKGYNFHDIFIFENSFWNTLRGRIFWNFYEFGNHLGVHFSPGLFLLLPFYALVPKPHTLLFLQSMAVVLAGIPLFRLSRKILKDDASSFLVTLSYWCYAPTLGASFSGFHETLFVLPFLFGLLWALEIDQKRLFWVFAVLSLIWKETFSLMFLFLGISFLLQAKTRKTGLNLLILSMAWCVWSFFIIIPLLRGAPVSSSLIRYRFPGEIGHSFQEIIINFVKNPGFFFRFAFQKEKVFYLFQLLIPLLFLPFFNPLLLVPILPQLGENLLSRHLFGASLLKHYTAAMIPFLFYAFLKGIPRLTALFEKMGINSKHSLRLIASVMLLLCLLMIFPSEIYVYILKGERNKDEELHYLSPQELQAAWDMGESVPEDASFAVSGHLAKYFARRKVICYISEGFLKIYPFDYLLYYAPAPDDNLFQKNADLGEMLNNNYTMIDNRGRLFLYQRKPVPIPYSQKSLYEQIPD